MASPEAGHHAPTGHRCGRAEGPAGERGGGRRSPAETNWSVNNEANCGLVVAALGNDVSFGVTSPTVFLHCAAG